MPTRQSPIRRRLIITAATALLVTLTATQTADASSRHSPSKAPSESSTQSTTCPIGWWQKESDVGIAECGQTGGRGEIWNLIVINPNEGAKMRIVSQHDTSSPQPPSEDAAFRKKSADEWADYILSNNVGPPSSSKLSHVVNAGFLVTDTGSSSPLSLPEKRSGSLKTYGYALAHTTDWAFGWPDKRYIKLGDPNELRQWADVGPFPYPWGSPPPGYTKNDVDDVFYYAYDATVAYGPHSAPSEADAKKRRTFFLKDINSERAYILTTSSATLADVNSKVEQLHAQNPEILIWDDQRVQLDGGRSTQTYSVKRDSWWVGPIWRRVPEVLAIYHG